jgi:hypothetical protein
MSDRDVLVCPRCGESDGFFENIEAHGWRPMDLRREGAKFKFEPDRSALEVDHLNVTSSGPVECRCGATFPNGIEDLRLVYDDWRTGDVAILPDGLRGIIATVQGQEVMIEGWHEVFKMRELTPTRPISKVEPMQPPLAA